jgi:PAS domain S-box-containing protein
VSQELNERRQAEQALRESEQRYRWLAENVEDVIWVRDASWQRYTYMSPSIQRMLGYQPAEMLEKPMEEFMTAASCQIINQMAGEMLQAEQQGSGDNEARRFELEWIRNDGTTLWAESTMRSLHDSDGCLIGMVGVTRDVTLRKLADEQLRASLAEKEVLLREIHHRVKNNLEVIISLADLQARTITDSKALQSIRELQERVRTIALVHEDLYRSTNLASIRAQPYLLRLVDNLIQVFGSAGIDLQVQAADLSLSIDSAIPCGLILTELVTNAIKHAFPVGPEPAEAGKQARLRQIRVDLFEKDSQFVLEVCDNGVGLPPDLDWQTTRSLGLRLVTRLAGQLHGSLDVDIQNGTRFRLTFPRPD